VCVCVCVCVFVGKDTHKLKKVEPKPLVSVSKDRHIYACARLRKV